MGNILQNALQNEAVVPWYGLRIEHLITATTFDYPRRLEIQTFIYVVRTMH